MVARRRWSREREGPHPDAGLQAERTAMAWQGTALGLAGIAALLLHETGGSPVSALPGIFGLAMATALLVLSELRYESTASRIGEAGTTSGGDRLPLLLAATVSLLAGLAILLILVQG